MRSLLYLLGLGPTKEALVKRYVRNYELPKTTAWKYFVESESRWGQGADQERHDWSHYCEKVRQYCRENEIIIRDDIDADSSGVAKLFYFSREGYGCEVMLYAMRRVILAIANGSNPKSMEEMTSQYIQKLENYCRENNITVVECPEPAGLAGPVEKFSFSREGVTKGEMDHLKELIVRTIAEGDNPNPLQELVNQYREERRRQLEEIRRLRAEF